MDIKIKLLEALETLLRASERLLVGGEVSDMRDTVRSSEGMTEATAIRREGSKTYAKRFRAPAAQGSSLERLQPAKRFRNM